MDKFVLVIDDHPMIRAGLRIMLAHAHSTIETKEASTVGEAIALLLANTRFDLVIYDWHLPGGGGARGLVSICQLAPRAPVVVISGDEDGAVSIAAKQIGAAAFLSKSEDPKVVHGVLIKLLGLHADQCEDNGSPMTDGDQNTVKLSRRQNEVLMQLGIGRSNKQIAKLFEIADTTVKTHVSEILRAFDARTRAEAVFKAKESGFFKDNPGKSS